jgi:basic membrane protein A
MQPLTVRRRVRPARVALVLLVLLGLVAAACGGDDSGSADRRDQPFRIGVLYGGSGDPGADDGVRAGLALAKDQHHLDVEELEPDPSGADREVLLGSLAEDGVDLVLAVGPGTAAAVTAAAKTHPDQRFVVLGGVASGDNVTSLVFSDEQAAYLAGAAATMSSGSHHLGFLAGSDDDRAKRLEAGFRAGARKVVDASRVDVAHVPAPAGDAGGFDAAAAQAAAKGLFDGGADVVLAMPEAAGPAVLAAALEHGGGVKAVRVGEKDAAASQPQAAGVLLTSVLVHPDAAVQEIVTALVQGALGSGTRTYGVADGGVGLDPSPLITPTIQAKLDELTKQITDGQVQVPLTP